MSALELALQRNKYKHLSDEEWRWFLQQVEGRERTADKLPTFATIEDWWYPVRLSCEQCSSEQTARYKASLLSPFNFHLSPFNFQFSPFNFHLSSLLDLTGGYGVDAFFLSEHFAHTDYVEQNAELCRIAAHNAPLFVHNAQFTIHNTTAEEFLNQIVHRTSLNRTSEYSLIFLDPARRDSHGGKVFRLEDCTPNVVELLPTLLEHLAPEGRLMLKLSPMLDISQALSALSAVRWDVHVVAVKNEVKEVLLLSTAQAGTITAIDLAEPDKAFTFTREQERDCPSIINYQLSIFNYLYEPNAAILKAGGYKLIAQRFGLEKVDVNTHMYCSDRLVEHFPGRVWKVLSPVTGYCSQLTRANIVCRNYPLRPEELRKKLKLKDGGEQYVIGLRIHNKPALWLAERVQ